MAHKLLLADDSVTIQRVIELTFADEDVDVTTVGDGQQAIDRILSDRPDIILADAGMPKRDGFEVASFVKNDPDLQHIPVLLLTGAFEPVDEQRVKAAGCDGVLAKPFEPQLLIARVKELLTAAKKRRTREPGRTPGLPTLADLRIQREGPPSAEPVHATTAPQPDVPVEPPSAAEPPLQVGPTAEEPVNVATPASDVEAPPSPADVDQTPPPMRDRRAAQTAAPDQAATAYSPTPIVQGTDEMGLSAYAADADPGAPLSLDEYFDQLDAAFATMTPAAETLSPIADSATPPSRPSAGWAGGPDEIEWVQQIVRERVDAGGPAGASEAGTRSEPAPASPASPRPAVPLATTFSTMLAAEQGEKVPPEALSATGVSPVPVDALVEDVTRRVVERLADRAVREQVADIVSTIAERLVREEIERLKAKL